MKLETSDCWQNEENFKALLMVTKIFNLSLWKVEKMSNENRAIFMRRVVSCESLRVAFSSMAFCLPASAFLIYIDVRQSQVSLALDASHKSKH